MLSFYSESIQNTENVSTFPFIFLFILFCFCFLTIFPHSLWMLDMNMHRKYWNASREHLTYLFITIKVICRMPTAVLGEVGDRAMQWYWSRRAKGKAGVGWSARPASSLSLKGLIFLEKTEHTFLQRQRLKIRIGFWNTALFCHAYWP